MRLLIVALSVCAMGNVLAVERLIRRYDWRAGFPVQSVYNLGQDDQGFLWIAGNALFRYDGREMRTWSSARGALVPGSARVGRTSIVDETRHTVCRVTPSGVAPVVNAKGQPLDQVVSAAYSDDGSLWYVPLGAPRELWRLSPDGAAAGTPFWSAAEDIRFLRQGGGATIVAITGRGASRLGPSSPSRTWALPRVRDVLVRADGTLVMAVNRLSGETHHGKVLEERDGSFVTLLDVPRSRIIEMAERGGELWAAFDIGLVKVGPDGTSERIGKAEGLESGGPLLVDREGSLWVGTIQGLVQFPEPDTVGWGDVDEDVGRWVTRSASGETWMPGWRRLLRVSGSPGRWRVRTYATPMGPPCADARGGVWTASGDLYEFQPERTDAVVHHSTPVLCGPCSTGPSGGWLAGPTGLLHIGRQGTRPRAPRFQPPPRSSPPGGLDTAVEDNQGQLWVSRGGSICHADAKAVANDSAATWTCETVSEASEFNALAVTPSGDLWAVVDLHRLLRRAGGRWEPVPGAADLGAAIHSVVPSPSGGFWVAGDETTLRVLERPDLPAGWEIVEVIDAWQGLLALKANWMTEDEAGGLWIAGNASLMYVPTHARRARPGPLQVGVAEVRANGLPVSTASEFELPYGHNGLDVRVAAPSFRDPQRLRYRIRLGPDDRWSDPAKDPVFRFQRLRSGHYRAEVAASLDGTSWISASAPIEFRVARPWFLQWSVLVSSLIAAAALAYAAHRVRIVQLVRLERQRARIAMDLHDEIGSGLGSIGILSELSARPQMQDVRRRELGSEINRIAAALAGSLSDLAGSLRPGAATLESLAQQVAERAHALFPDGTAEVVSRLPQPIPPVRLSLPVRRNVLLVATEALHNAARHSGASRIEFGLAVDGRRWRLWVGDNGRGIASDGAASTTTHGLGLTSMRRRAGEIGAGLSISTAGSNGGGTVVSLVFDPLAEDRRLVD